VVILAFHCRWTDAVTSANPLNGNVLPALRKVDAATELVTSFGAKFHVLGAAVDEASFERATLRHVRNHTRPDDAVLYFHSKGVSDDKQARHLPHALRAMLPVLL